MNTLLKINSLILLIVSIASANRVEVIQNHWATKSIDWGLLLVMLLLVIGAIVGLVLFNKGKNKS